MPLTNKYNIPSPIPEIIEEGGHAPKPGRYSVTDLINPPLIRSLRLEHYDELCSDVSDYLWMLLGTAVDNMLSARLGLDAQYKMEYDPIDGVTVVGVADVIVPPYIDDWKVTSTYTLNNEERIQEYANQLNMYVWLWDNAVKGKPIEHIRIQAYLRDWMVSKAMYDPHYPKCQLTTIDLTSKLLSPEDREHMVLSRLEDHLDNPMRECTPHEKWQSETTYAVKNGKIKKALRVLPTEEDAERWIAGKNTTGLWIETRPGKCARCQSYCNVSAVCPYNKEK